VTSQFALRQVRENDKWLLWRWRNSPRIREVSLNNLEIPEAAHDAWFEANYAKMRDRTILVEASGRPVGWFQIEKWDESDRRGEWGIAIGEPESVPLGFGGALPLLALSHAFDRLGATTMTARVLDVNRNVRSMMTRLRVPVTDHVVDPTREARGEPADLTVYEVAPGDWSGIRRRGQELLPSSVWRIFEQLTTKAVEG